VVERIRGGGRTQRMRTDLETKLRRIGPHQLVDPVRGDRVLKPPGAVVADRPEQRTIFIGAVTGSVSAAAATGRDLS